MDLVNPCTKNNHNTDINDSKHYLLLLTLFQKPADFERVFEEDFINFR